MATNQDAVASSTAATTTTTAAVTSSPATDESHLPPSTSNPDDGTMKDTAGAAAGVDPKPDDQDHRLDANAEAATTAAVKSKSKKAPKSRRKAKVVKATPPTADSDTSDSSTDDSDDDSRVADSDSDTDDTTNSDPRPNTKKALSKHGRKEKKSKKAGKSKKQSEKVKKKKSKGHSVRSKASGSKAKNITVDAGSDSDSDSDYSDSPSDSASSSSSSSSSRVAAKKVKKKRKNKVQKRFRGSGDLNTAALIDEVVQTVLERFLQLQAATQPSIQYPSLGLGGQPQTSFSVPQNTVFPGTTASYTSPPFAETNIVETPRASLLNPRQARGRRGAALRDLGSQPPSEIIDIDGQVSDSLASIKDQKKNKKKKKKGTRADFKRVDWVWDSSLYTWKLQDSTESTNDSQYEEYIFHVRRSFDIEGRYRSTTVDIKSKLLRECLQDVIGDVKGVSLVDESPKTDPNMLFLYLEDLRAHRKELKRAEPAGTTKKERRRNQRRLDTKRKQLKVLIGYLDKDYSRTKESLYPMLENGLITFELMWALWKPGTLAYTSTYGSTDDPRVFKVELAERHKSFMKGELYHLDGKYFEFDGKKFGQGAVSDEILAFRGARKITSLPCYPLKYHPEEKKLRERLIERGKKFVSLSGVHYKSYSGMAYQKSKKCVIKFNIQQSRVMVDPAIFRRINPNYYISPVKAQEESLIFGSGLSDDDDDSEPYNSDSSGAGHARMTKAMQARKLAAALLGAGSNSTGSDISLDIDPASAGQGLVNGNGAYEAKDTDDGKPLTFSDEEYLMASPVVLGFAFSEKQWLEFTVDSIKEIVWNDTAWDSLVSEPETKDLVQALVKSRKYHAANTIDDVIQGKGKGLVTVLHGPPGTGKTLTAEGISELLKCPLYMASAGELGTDSRFLEAELQKILDICHAWGAILLLDEADVFLEKRNMLDIHRNALVSIFLRQLEYFQGILFLTTNRVETFDEAFQSRIHIALRYGALEPKAKKAIFKMFIDKVRNFGKMKVASFSEEDLDALSRKELNGREIKNVVSSAQDLAVNKEEALSMSHIKQVLDVHAKFGRDLKGGAGFEDAMRSYF